VTFVLFLRWATQGPAPFVFFKDISCLYCCLFTFCPKTHYLSHKFAIPFAVLIYLVYITYCKICDRLYLGYKDTDLASLNVIRINNTLYINIALPLYILRYDLPNGLWRIHICISFKKNKQVFFIKMWYILCYYFSTIEKSF